MKKTPRYLSSAQAKIHRKTRAFNLKRTGIRELKKYPCEHFVDSIGSACLELVLTGLFEPFQTGWTSPIIESFLQKTQRIILS